jgi:hypothetical protein
MKTPYQGPCQLHVLIRVSAGAGSDSVHDIVAEHKAVIKARGRVWFGMRKLRIRADHVEQLKQQHERSEPTYLYLVQRHAQGFIVYRATVAEVSSELPSHSQDFVPAYYVDRGMIQEIGSWLELTDFRNTASAEFERLHIPSSGRRVEEVLKRSQLSFALVSSIKP